MQIEHDPHEPPPDRSGNASTWGGLLLIGLCWAVLLYVGFPFDWASLAIGAGTMAFLIAGARKLTGDRLPDWWPR